MPQPTSPARYLFAPVLAVTLALFGLSAASAQTVFINEIHYDNTGTDAGEAIEVAGPAGTDLTGWSLVLYNGSNGAAYDTDALSGTIPNLGGTGFGVVSLSYPVNGIQNGSPDGIALVNGATVVQFLSYEGTFTAAGGPADGMLSTDIGVLETGSEPLGQSLRLSGCGTTYADFAWNAPATASFGAINAGQSFSPSCLANPPLLNEFVANHTGTDTNEYVEIKGDPATDYSSYTVLAIEGDTGASFGVIDRAYTIGTTDANGYWFTGFLADQLENGSQSLLLVSGFTGTAGTSDVDANDDGLIDTAFWSAIVDDVAVTDGGAGDGAYSATVLAPGYDGNSNTVGGASRIPDGADTDTAADWTRNAFDGAGLAAFPAATGAPGEAPNTPQAENEVIPAPPVVADLVINEIDYDQPSTDTAEFVEIKNTGIAAINLAGFEMRWINGNGGGAAVYKTLVLPSFSLPAGGYFVVCANAANTPKCDLDTTPDTNLTQNGNPDAVAIAVAGGGAVIDTVSYGGDTGAPYTEGSGAGLLDPVVEAFGGISRFPDGGDTDVNNSDLSFRCITPGKANVAASSACADPRPPRLVINEIDYDQPGGDGAEFVEIFNAGTTPADLALAALELVNGNAGGAVVYSTIPLSGSLPGGAYLVVCGNAANVVGCDLDVSPNSDLLQNGAPDAIGLRFDGELVDAVSYEGNTGAPYTEGSGIGLEDSGLAGEDFKGIARFPNGVDTQVNNVDLVRACITPGFANSSSTSGCTDLGPAQEIFAIQGAGLASPFVGQGLATLDNTVTATAPDGFFIQTPDARADGDTVTSNGIFVFTGGAPGVAVGDQVDVGGQVSEFFGFTEIDSPVVRVDSAGNPLPAVVAFGATTPSPDPTTPSCAAGLGTLAENNFECFEGMRVQIVGGRVTGPSQFFGSDPIAEAHITAASDRVFREPGALYPGVGGSIPVWDGNPEVLELDPNRLGLPNQAIVGGSTFDAIGVIGFEFSGYELFPSSLSITAAPTVPIAVRPRESGEMTIGSLNLFRFFDDINDPPDGDRDDDGAHADYASRRAKFALYILDVLDAPDIVGVQEAEKLEVLQSLAAAIAALDPSVVYTAYLVESNDIGQIDSGFLVRDSVAVDAVTQLGNDELLTWDGSLLHDRAPLLLEGRYHGNFPVAVICIHNRSLSGIEDSGSGPRVRQKRFEQAESVAAMIQGFQTANPAMPLVLVGDFNAFEFTDGFVDAVGHIKGDFDPDEALICQPGEGTGGGTNACADLVNPDFTDQILELAAAERYSFNFGGSAQVLDHALTSQSTAPWLRGFELARGNSDAPAGQINDSSTPLRSSDHDGFALYLMTDEDADSVPDDLDVCPGTEIPEPAPSNGLKANHWVLADGDGVFDTIGSGNGHGPFTIAQTGGCSCTQIIDELGLGNGQRKNGCSTGTMEDWIELVNP